MQIQPDGSVALSAQPGWYYNQDGTFTQTSPLIAWLNSLLVQQAGAVPPVSEGFSSPVAERLAQLNSSRYELPATPTAEEVKQQAALDALNAAMAVPYPDLNATLAAATANQFPSMKTRVSNLALEMLSPFRRNGQPTLPEEQYYPEVEAGIKNARPSLLPSHFHSSIPTLLPSHRPPTFAEKYTGLEPFVDDSIVSKALLNEPPLMISHRLPTPAEKLAGANPFVSDIVTAALLSPLDPNGGVVPLESRYYPAVNAGMEMSRSPAEKLAGANPFVSDIVTSALLSPLNPNGEVIPLESRYYPAVNAGMSMARLPVEKPTETKAAKPRYETTVNLGSSFSDPETYFDDSALSHIGETIDEHKVPIALAIGAGAIPALGVGANSLAQMIKNKWSAPYDLTDPIYDLTDRIKPVVEKRAPILGTSFDNAIKDPKKIKKNIIREATQNLRGTMKNIDVNAPGSFHELINASKNANAPQQKQIEAFWKKVTKSLGKGAKSIGPIGLLSALVLGAMLEEPQAAPPAKDGYTGKPDLPLESGWLDYLF